jgi:hypothetical protein
VEARERMTAEAFILTDGQEKKRKILSDYWGEGGKRKKTCWTAMRRREGKIIYRPGDKHPFKLILQVRVFMRGYRPPCASSGPRRSGSHGLGSRRAGRKGSGGPGTLLHQRKGSEHDGKYPVSWAKTIRRRLK